jgi:GNAT superfamily N-acetyltransferase
MPGNRRALGYVGLEVSDLELHKSLTGNVIYVPWLAVHEYHHRKGIGTRLMSEAILLARGWSTSLGPTPIALHADSSIHEFYKPFGFEQVGSLMVLPASVIAEI